VKSVIFLLDVVATEGRIAIVVPSLDWDANVCVFGTGVGIDVVLVEGFLDFEIEQGIEGGIDVEVLELVADIGSPTGQRLGRLGIARLHDRDREFRRDPLYGNVEILVKHCISYHGDTGAILFTFSDESFN
jgi:hypothetical protein